MYTLSMQSSHLANYLSIFYLLQFAAICSEQFDDHVFREPSTHYLMLMNLRISSYIFIYLFIVYLQCYAYRSEQFENLQMHRFQSLKARKQCKNINLNLVEYHNFTDFNNDNVSLVLGSRKISITMHQAWSLKKIKQKVYQTKAPRQAEGKTAASVPKMRQTFSKITQ